MTTLKSCVCFFYNRRLCLKSQLSIHSRYLNVITFFCQAQDNRSGPESRSRYCKVMESHGRIHRSDLWLTCISYASLSPNFVFWGLSYSLTSQWAWLTQNNQNLVIICFNNKWCNYLILICIKCLKSFYIILLDLICTLSKEKFWKFYILN